MKECPEQDDKGLARNWSGFNNIGICAVAILSVLQKVTYLSLPKTMLIMPLAMHESTLRFLAKGNVRERKVAAFVSMNPEFVANFDKRYRESLGTTLNAIQLLIELGHVRFDGQLLLVKELLVDDTFGKQAQLMVRAAKNIAALLSSDDDELYLNFRVKL